MTTSATSSPGARRAAALSSWLVVTAMLGALGACLARDTLQHRAASCPAGASCDDGDPCTVGDACALGVCAGGKVSTACATGTKPIYRSVGPGRTAALAVGGPGKTLLVTGTSAIFSSPLPDEVGVGDVIEYRSTGTGPYDAVAFIHGRSSPTHYAVRNARGGDPVQMTAGPDDAWGVFRAYTSLADAASGSENVGLDADLANFDTFAGGRDLVANGESWNIACYGEAAPDTGSAVFCAAPCGATPPAASWSTSPTSYLRIYTPTASSEVGVSQRHRGSFAAAGAPYYRLDGELSVCALDVRVEGLVVRQPLADRAAYAFCPADGGDVRVSDSLGWATAKGDAFSFWTPAAVTVTAWNLIGVNDASEGSAFTVDLHGASASAHLYGCTGVAGGGHAYTAWYRGECVNCLGVTAEPGCAFWGNWNSVSHSLAGDDSLTAANACCGSGCDVSTGNLAQQALSAIGFVDAAAGDYHLSAGSAAQAHGANLGSGPFATDVDGEARPPAGGWDIGADQIH